MHVESIHSAKVARLSHEKYSIPVLAGKPIEVFCWSGHARGDVKGPQACNALRENKTFGNQPDTIWRSDTLSGAPSELPPAGTT
jgi:hypothetical protein